MSNDTLLQWLRGQRDRDKGRMDDFAKKFEEAPVSALQWSDSTFDAVGRWQALSVTIHLLEKGVSLEDMHARALDDVRNGARNGERSTAVAANRMTQAELTGWAEVEEMLRGALQSAQKATPND